MKQADKTHRADAQVFKATARKRARSVGARKSTGKRVTKSGDSGKGSTQERHSESGASAEAGDQAFERHETFTAGRSRVTFTIA